MPHPRGRKPIDLDFTLRRVFRKKSFRPLQREVITAAIDGKDVFLQAATSFGKSLCFQLPAVIGHGITVVVSPLLALMNNQVDALRKAGIVVETINSNTTLSERKRINLDLLCGHPETRLLYVTPELCQTETFRRNMIKIHQQGELLRIAIDEAHCISEWGHDFRIAYTALCWFKQTLILPAVPIIAFTAIATPKVRQDIISSLALNPATLKSFTTPTARPNLHYEIRYFSESNPQTSDDQFKDLLDWLTSIRARRTQRFSHAANDDNQNNPTNPTMPSPSPPLTMMSGIIYVPLRTHCTTLATRLSAHSIPAVPFHAGLDPVLRKTTQDLWLSNAPTHSIIVATTAFGMGIDKPDVRFVIHWGLPRSVENFVQEAGRAGRDGKAAVSRVYYSREERDRILWLLARDAANANNHGCKKNTGQPRHEARLASFHKFVEYCETVSKCRHGIIGQYFGDSEKPVCDFACDYCKDVADGKGALRRRKERGLATDEDAFEFTQRERSGLEEGGGAWDDD